MPNPIITPIWVAGASFTVTQSNQLRVDVRVSDLGAPAEIEVSPPGSATIQLLRDPGNWTSAGVAILTGGMWQPPVTLGDWRVTAVPGAPSVLSVSSLSGVAADGILRLVITGLGGAAITLAPGGGDLSIDRLIADPGITNAQVTSGSPVHELDAVQMSAMLTSTVSANAAPLLPLAAAPPVVGVWTPAAANAVAVKNFTSAGATASFTAPAIYAPVALDFQVAAALDLASNGTIDAGDPTNTTVLNVPISTVRHRMVLVLDRSGSMSSTLGGGDTKWEATIKAAHAWIDLFRALRPGNTHLAGIITFEHDPCTWNATPAVDISLRNPTDGSSAGALSALDTFADVTSINLGPVQSCTPIGDALVKAYQVIEGGDLTDTKGSVVLLTDGYENSGATTIAASPPSGAPGVQPLATLLNSWPGPGVDLVDDRVFTLAVGSSVDEDRLNALAVGTGYYQLTNDLTDLIPAFTNMLGEVLSAEQANPVIIGTDPDSPPHALYFQVPSNEQRVVFLLPWDNFNDQVRVGWRTSGSAASFTLIASPNPAVVVSEQRDGHGIVAVDLATLTGGPVPGTEWRVQHMSGEPAQAQPLTDTDVVMLRDLHTQAEINLDRQQYFIGEPIRMTCSIRTGGAPLTGASVEVDVARPGEGLGTFLATNSDMIPDVPVDRSHLDGTQRGTGSADPDQGKGLMFKTLLRLTEQDMLPVIGEPDLELFDDGAHGDGAANDGDYSNVFTNTLKEGTYTFRFRVNGQLPDGSTFSRLFVRSTWVGVKPDPAATLVAWQLGRIVNGLQIATLTFTPQTASGELLGPFRHAVIGFGLWNATLDGQLVDRLDGSYQQNIAYQPGDIPIVVPEVYGQPLGPTGPTIRPGGYRVGFAKHSRQVMDIRGASIDSGANLIQWPYHGGDNQRLRLEPLDDGHYRIVVNHSGKVLDVSGASTTSGARVIQWDWHGGDNQRWKLDALGGNYYRLIAKHSGKVLDVSGASTASGAQVIQWDWHGGENQRWKLDAVPVFVRHSGQALDVRGASMTAGADLIQWPYHGGENQRFRVEPLDDGHCRIVAEHSGQVLDVSGASTAAGAKVIQWDWHGGANQRFRIEPVGDGLYRVIAKHSGRVLDVFGASTASGAQVIQWDWHGGDNQRWQLIVR